MSSTAPSPPPSLLTEFTVCGPDLEECEEHARQYQGKFVESNFYHYEFLSDHFKNVKGYNAYQQKAEIAPLRWPRRCRQRLHESSQLGAHPTRSSVASRNAGPCWATSK